MLHTLQLSCENYGTNNESRGHQPIEVGKENNGIKINNNKPELKLKRTATVIDSMYIKDVRENQSDSN